MRRTWFGGGAGGGASLLNDSPAVSFVYEATLGSFPAPDLFSFSGVALTSVHVFDPDGTDHSYDPVTLLGSDPVALFPGASEYGLVSNDNTGNIPQAGVMTAGLYVVDCQGLFGSPTPGDPVNVSVGIRMVLLNVPASSSTTGPTQFEKRLVNPYPPDTYRAGVPSETLILAQFDLTAAGVSAGEPSQFNIGAQQTSGVDDMPVTITIGVRRVL